MIYHFIKRDFLTHKLFWIILGLVSLVAVPSMAVSRHFTAMFLFYAYGLFGMIPMNSLTGVSWRSQHVMSRNYMLALPIDRKTLFLITQVRALVFWIPFMGLAMFLPTTLGVSWHDHKLPISVYPEFYPRIVLAVVWMINTLITLQLAVEKVTSYLTQQRRATAWVGMFAVYLGEFAAVFFCFLIPAFLEYQLGPWLALLTLAMLAALRFSIARKRWLCNQ